MEGETTETPQKEVALAALLDLMREKGVYEFTYGNLTVKFGDLPSKSDDFGRDEPPPPESTAYRGFTKARK